MASATPQKTAICQSAGLAALKLGQPRLAASNSMRPAPAMNAAVPRIGSAVCFGPGCAGRAVRFGAALSTIMTIPGKRASSTIRRRNHWHCELVAPRVVARIGIVRRREAKRKSIQREEPAAALTNILMHLSSRPELTIVLGQFGGALKTRTLVIARLDDETPGQGNDESLALLQLILAIGEGHGDQQHPASASTQTARGPAGHASQRQGPAAG